MSVDRDFCLESVLSECKPEANLMQPWELIKGFDQRV